ncbi:hypothetical protein CMPELA_09570 [Cupriavidus necator]|uniref:Uncharacterized protein n=2 Tax=Cupriavidus necator TaxID=106590 RepID=Q0KAH6_CUPNH|nr:hypothetical protein [Cupriavidus necator]QQB76336.1 hypothetical protein I6H87_16440 [Cupriavidus necator]WKA39202.1 hypothetical protein QWP09_09695 [Cupriavidus necator]CAJ92995.1 Hypothetical protein H16_A1894 [Cupriavidus necator H16]
MHALLHGRKAEAFARMPLKLAMGEPGPTTTIGAMPKMPTGTKSLIGSNGKEWNMPGYIAVVDYQTGHSTNTHMVRNLR